jgi:uncharacterized damage-inducible protein DinB
MTQRNLLEMSGRELGQTWWKAAWDEGLWAAGWQASIADLTPQQAAWTPAPGRHSIWQIVLHMVFWREYWLGKLAGGQKASPEEIARSNWPEIPHVTDEAWMAAKHQLGDTQRRIGTLLEATDRDVEALLYFIPHDAYHFGQINQLRAFQGLRPIE